LDFGIKHGERFRGLKILTFEEILKKFSCHTVMNIHIKSKNNVDPLPDGYLRKIVALIDKYDCRGYVYFMSGNDTVLAQLGEIAPDICRCCGGGNDKWGIVERAIKLGCGKVQLVKGCFNREMINKAHENGIICNVFWSDDQIETKEFLNMGIDTVLTNDYGLISDCVKSNK
jgi:glycerophosphoryl diester phosphodiesterase